MSDNYYFDKRVFKNQLKKVSNNKSFTEIQSDCHLPKGVLSKYTIDKTNYQYPPIDVLMRIASTYKCSLDDLVKENGEVKHTNEYKDFSDFARDLLGIFENEDCFIEKVFTGTPSERYCITFGNDRSFLDEALSPGAKEMFLEYAGYCMTTDTRQQKFLMFTGEGGTGKSVFINLVAHAIGYANISSIDLKSLADNRFSSFNLFQKLLNVCADIDKPLQPPSSVSPLP